MNTTGSQEDTANGLSRRGSNASQSQVRSDTDLFYEAMANLHHHEDNPSGALPMNVAENKLGWTELKAKIEAISASQPLPDWVAGYTGAKGNPEVLAVLAEFMSTHLAQRELIYSRNPAFNRAADNLNVAHMASNLTQWTIQQVLADHAFVDAFISNNRKRLTESYIEVVEALRRSGIPYVPSRGSLFVWADFSEFLEDQTEAADHQLWLRIYDATGILLTPGAGFGHTKHGMYRIVYPSLPRTSVHAALSRLEALVMGWREVETA